MESWVKKSEIELKDELFGDGKGFNLGLNNPKMFTVGRRLDIEQELNSIHISTVMTLYLYEINIG